MKWSLRDLLPFGQQIAPIVNASLTSIILPISGWTAFPQAAGDFQDHMT
jgi:hypothetical protein